MYDMTHFDMHCILCYHNKHTISDCVHKSEHVCRVWYVYFVDSEIAFSQLQFHWKVSSNTDLSTGVEI